jgi:hypothetical protein
MWETRSVFHISMPLLLGINSGRSDTREMLKAPYFSMVFGLTLKPPEKYKLICQQRRR